MSALTDNRATPELQGRSQQELFAVLAGATLYAGGMLAVDYADEAQPATDTAGLRVLGRTPRQVVNTADGEETNVQHGIFRYENSALSPVSRSAIGEACYVEDDQTVAGASSHFVAAGLVYDVEADGVWVDQRPGALALARRACPPTVSEITDDAAVDAATAFGGRTVYRCAKAGGLTLSLPSAVAGMRLGVQRSDASAGADVTVQAAAGDSVQGSDPGKRLVNDTDAVSRILWLRALDDGRWLADMPLAEDAAEWEVDNS